MAFITLLKYAPQHLKQLRRNSTAPLDSATINSLKKNGIHRQRSRPRGSKAGRRFYQRIKPIVGVRPYRRYITEEPRGSNPSNLQPVTLSVKQQIQHKPKLSTVSLPSLLLCNARSLCNKLEELECRLIHSKSDIAIVSETWFKDNDTAESIDIDRFTTYSHPRVGKVGGGVAIYVNNKISSKRLDIAVPPELECMWIHTRPHKLPRSVPSIAICAVYFPPKSPHADLLINHLIESVDALRVKSPDIGLLICGDLNHLEVDGLCKSHRLKQIVKNPTRGNNILDLIITNLSPLYSVPIITEPLDSNDIDGQPSDHNCIILHPSQRRIVNHTVQKVSRPMKDSSIQHFGQWITAHEWHEVYSKLDVVEKSSAMYATINEKIQEFFPSKVTRLHNRDKPWMTPEIKTLINQRQLAFHNKESDRWKVLRNKAKDKIKLAKNSFYNEKIKSLKNQNASEWHRHIKNLANLSQSEAIFHIDGIDPEDLKGIANSINKSLCLVTQSLAPIDLAALPAFLPAEPAPTIQPWEVYEKLKRVNTRKAAGPDQIPGRLIKEFACELSEPLADIINHSLQDGIVPLEWKSATVVPLPKSKPPSTSEIRPISLTSLLSKVAESFITQWTLKDILPQIDSQQFGCLPGRSTTHSLLDLTNDLYRSLDRPGKICSLVTTDYSKAFDRVDHSLTIATMLKLGLRPSLARWIANFLSDRSQSVRYHGSLSDSEKITCGLPQGTLLGPWIFIAYINGAAKDATAKRWKFVDDLNLLEVRPLNAPSIIQQDLADLERWSSERKMVLHPKKCKVLHFFTTKSPPTFPNLTINDLELQKVSTLKILGIYIQSNLKWSEQVDHLCKTASQRLFLLRRLKNSAIPPDDLTSIFTIYIRPTLEYAAPVWHSGLTGVQSKAIERVQRRAVRIILGRDFTSYRNACSRLGLPSLSSRREDLTRAFATSLRQSDLFRSWLPPERGEISQRLTRSSNDLDLASCTTERYKKSAIPYMIRLLNN